MLPMVVGNRNVRQDKTNENRGLIDFSESTPENTYSSESHIKKVTWKDKVREVNTGNEM